MLLLRNQFWRKGVFKRYSENDEDSEAPSEKLKSSGNDSKSFRSRKSYGNSSGKRFRGASSRCRGSYSDRSHRDKHRDESPNLKDDCEEDSKHDGKEKNRSKFFSSKPFSKSWASLFKVVATIL